MEAPRNQGLRICFQTGGDQIVYSPGGACSLKDGFRRVEVSGTQASTVSSSCSFFVLSGSRRWCLSARLLAVSFLGFLVFQDLVLHLRVILSRLSPFHVRKSIVGGVLSGSWSWSPVFLLLDDAIKDVSSQCRGASFDCPWQIQSCSSQCRSCNLFHQAAFLNARFSSSGFACVSCPSGMKPLSLCVLIRQRFFKCGLE
ncbi:unnamed protein product [Brassica rapa]|uniref:Uncharacterized protein n=2 Tax=Brassica TaxID=3705 RepID=A0A8D9DGT1_BRACM|nr:unnamed protein product [Brassica napus]CAG7875376.1 unnamed protein product [Brassica rapa]